VSDKKRSWDWLIELGILSVIAWALATYISTRPPFERISAVVSDEISRSLGFSSNGPIVLVRINRALPKADLEQLLTQAIPALIGHYGAATLGIDIDFSGRGYENLAKEIVNWGRERQPLADQVIWSIGFQSDSPRGGSADKLEVCDNCANDKCMLRVSPQPVFAGDFEPPKTGLAYVWNDSSGISRSSPRFICHQDTIAQIKTFHFMLVQAYCNKHPDLDTCSELQPNRQAITKLHSWYLAEPLDLCSLVQCGPSFGKPAQAPSNALSDKVVILYSDVPGNDEHATIAGTRKGAELVASLVFNELQYGESREKLVESIKIALEILMTIVLGFFFHWSRTKDWAIIPSAVVFVVYLYAALKLSSWIPDFRDYALAVWLALAIEIWIKETWHRGHAAFTKAFQPESKVNTPAAPAK
jgi:hypothetical protein